MPDVKSNPFTVIKAREVFYVFLIANVMGTLVLSGRCRLSGMSDKDPHQD